MRFLPYALLVAAILLIPAYLFKPSDTGSNYFLGVLIFVGINTLLAVGLNLLMGYAGQVSLGHAAFYGMGAYLSAILTAQGVPAEAVAPMAAAVALMAAAAVTVGLLEATGVRLALALGGFASSAFLAVRFGAGHWLPYAAGATYCVLLARLGKLPLPRLAGAYAAGAVVGLGALALFGRATAAGAVSPWVAVLAGIVFSCLAAHLLGSQALRLHGHYLAMATLGFGVIVSIVFLQWEPVTGGTSGIYGIPNLSLAGHVLDQDVSVYFLVWGLVAVVIALSENIVSSRVGRAFRAVHSSEIAAATLGVDTTRYKVQVFVLSAALASLAGSLYAHYVTFISPEPFGFKFSVQLVVMVVVGGMASIWGAIFGAGAITVLGEVLRGLGDTPIRGLGVPLSDCDVVIFGLILMLIMIYLPAGLVRGVVDSIRLARRVGRWRPARTMKKAA